MKRVFIFSLALTTFLLGVRAAAPQTHEDVGRGAGPSSQTVSETPTKSRVASNGGEEFVIGTGDVLAINVWKESEVSKTVPVRSDGRISLPLIGELQAAGRTPRQLEAEIKARLKDYVSDPEVTVVVQEIHSQKFNVLGMVSHPGSFPLAKPMTVV